MRIALHAVPDEGFLPLVIREWALPFRKAIFVTSDDSMLQGLAAAMPLFLPDRPTHILPAWGTSPYERSRPSRAVTGTRVAGLVAVAEDAGPSLVVTTPEALLQRVPPAERLLERPVRLQPGQELDPEWLQATLTAFGYDLVERVDEAGEAIIRPGAVDVFPAGAPRPVRLELEDGRIAAMRQFDVADQLTTLEVPSLLLLPASEGFIVPGEAPELVRPLLPEGELATLFELMPDAALAMTDSFEQRVQDWLDLAQDSYRMAASTIRAGDGPPAEPARLYLRREEVKAAVADRQPAIVTIENPPKEPPLTLSAAARRASAAMADDRAAVACADIAPATLQTRLARRLRIEPDKIAVLGDWEAALRLQRGDVGVLRARLQFGFELPERVVLPVQTAQAGRTRPSKLEDYLDTLAIGDLVVELERGVAELAGLVAEDQAGAGFECLSLAFRGETNLLVPAIEAGRVWHYGAAGTLLPDRLEASTWSERRAQTERELQATASNLVAQLRERQAQEAPLIEPTDRYRSLVRGMPFVPTPDQAQAIRAVQQDFVAGHPMFRLICGDVGFGKTEVALHAAALAALAGHQVAIAAPTTLLARQHLEVFHRRLAGLDLRIAPLVRSSRSAENRDTLHGLADGSIDIVIGTHAVATAQFKRLGLVVIDEEQRFGEAHKLALRKKRSGLHSLVMTATPLPRTMQGALVGVVDVSLLTQPPAARLPIRSVVVPFDPVVVRTALLREARRGGQSFVVCPRIQDLAPMQARLAEIVPELSIVIAHGRLPGEELDRVVLNFASGKGDVLLTTNIVETGLDIANANTMLIWRADRFGMGQLHQLRGRIGRGRVRASAYLMTDAEHPPAAAALRRLEAVAGLGDLGAGFEISLADLDQRGAGDLLGEEQAGHLRLIGTELYRHLLTRALARARGEQVADGFATAIVVDAAAMVPQDFIPEPNVRLEIYRRLARISIVDSLDEFSEELTDRFGTLPEPLLRLLDITRLRLLCQRHGIAAVHAGPTGIAFTDRDGDRTVLALTPTSGADGLRHALKAVRDRYG